MWIFCIRMGLLRAIFATFATSLHEKTAICPYETEAIYILDLSGGDGDVVDGMSAG